MKDVTQYQILSSSWEWDWASFETKGPFYLLRIVLNYYEQTRLAVKGSSPDLQARTQIHFLGNS